MKYRSYRFVDGKARWVITEENGKIINRDPNKDELRKFDIEIRCHGNTREERYSDTNTCPRIKIDGKTCGNKLEPGNACHEYREGKPTGIWICKYCWGSDDQKERLIRDHKTGSLDPDCNVAKGDRFEDLSCKLYNAKGLNRDNYHCPIDNWCEEFGYFQTKGSYFNDRSDRWVISNLEREWNKKYDRMVVYCVSKDGKIIERIYEFPWEEIIKIKSIGIYKNPCRNVQWYEQYRIRDEYKLNVANNIWIKILEKEQNRNVICQVQLK